MNASAHTAFATTRDGIVDALTVRPSLLPAIKPVFLRDALRMKRVRGDADADQFKAVACDEFAYRLNATISGAAWALRQWIAKRPKWVGDVQHARRVAFLADLDAILDGSFGDHFVAEVA